MSDSEKDKNPSKLLHRRRKHISWGLPRAAAATPHLSADFFSAPAPVTAMRMLGLPTRVKNTNGRRPCRGTHAQMRSSDVADAYRAQDTPEPLLAGRFGS